MLAQTLLSHLKYTPCDFSTLVDVDWDNSILSCFGPQVIDRQVVLPPPPQKVNVSVLPNNKTLFDNHDPPVLAIFSASLQSFPCPCALSWFPLVSCVYPLQEEAMPLFQAGLSSYDASLFEHSSSSKHHCKRQTTKPNTASKSAHQASDVEKDGREEGATDFQKEAEALGGGDGQRGDDNQEMEIGDEVLGLRDSYGASVLHIAALHGYSSVLTTILDKWIGDVNLEDGNGLTAVDYAASGQLAASMTVDEEAACEKCRQLLCSRGGMHSSIWIADNPHASA